MLDKKGWAESWIKHLDGYLAGPPRTGAFVKQIVGRRIESALELGCGSSRDSIFLARSGFKCTATDYEDQAVERLKQRFSCETLEYRQADATDLPFQAKSFDLVFHNGLFILFEDDEVLSAMIREHCRVARKYFLAIVHNGENQELRQRFSRLASQDPIYDIRFFTRDILLDLALSAGLVASQVRFLKFGGLADVAYRPRLKQRFSNPFVSVAHRFAPALYQMQSWNRTERIACLITLGP